jgi:hypothetical protein
MASARGRIAPDSVIKAASSRRGYRIRWANLGKEFS